MGRRGEEIQCERNRHAAVRASVGVGAQVGDGHGGWDSAEVGVDERGGRRGAVSPR